MSNDYSKEKYQKEIDLLILHFENRDIKPKEAVALMMILSGINIAHTSDFEEALKQCKEILERSVNNEFNEMEWGHEKR